MSRFKKDAYLEISLAGAGSADALQLHQIRDFFMKQGVAPNQFVLLQTQRRYKACTYLKSQSKAEKMNKAF